MCEEDGNVDWDFPALDQVGLYLLYVLCTVHFVSFWDLLRLASQKAALLSIRQILTRDWLRLTLVVRAKNPEPDFLSYTDLIFQYLNKLNQMLLTHIFGLLFILHTCMKYPDWAKKDGIYITHRYTLHNPSRSRIFTPEISYPRADHTWLSTVMLWGILISSS